MAGDPDEISQDLIQSDQLLEEDPQTLLGLAAQANILRTATVVPGPDNKDWKTYWSKTEPEPWALVWDSFVTGGESLYDFYKTGSTVPYTFKSSSCIDGTAKSWGLSDMTDAQRANARAALGQLSAATGLSFAENTSGVTSGLVITMCDLGGSTYGQHFFDKAGDGKFQYTIALNRRWFGPDPNNTKLANDPLNPGDKSCGYVTLLHELAHASGLDDANTGSSGQLWQVAPGKDSTVYTVMAYTGSLVNTDYTSLDKQALSIIYRQTETKPPKKLLLGLNELDDEYEDEIITKPGNDLGLVPVHTLNENPANPDFSEPGGGETEPTGGEGGGDSEGVAKLAAAMGLTSALPGQAGAAMADLRLAPFNTSQAGAFFVQG